MATYLPNVKDYVPELKAYTPDFKFLSDALDQRQDRYNKTTKQLNNLYGDVVYADLSREDNQALRDSYAKKLAPKIQQISGLDFSLAQNVQAAKGLFKPFYEDEKLVRDIVYTKTYKDQMGLANSYKNAASDEQRKRYWDDGVQYMNYMMEDFQNKSRSESMSVPLPQYFENPNLYEKAMEVLNTGGPDGKGFKSTQTYVDQTGQFIVTQENGIALLSKPTGKQIANPNFDANKKVSTSNPKMIEEMYNPAANLINETITDDPTIVQGYQIKAYNNARKFYEEEAKKSGLPVDQFKRQWVQMQLGQFDTESKETLEKENVELNNTRSELASWDSYVKEAPLIEGSEEYQKWFYAMTKGETIEQGINKLEQKRNNILNGIDSEDLDALLNRGYAAYIANTLGKDIFTAARDYADLTSQHSFEESKIYLEKLRARNNKELELFKRRLDLEEQIAKDLEEIERNSFRPNPIPGDARENITSRGNQIERNEAGELKVHKEINTRKIQTLATFYRVMADDLNTQTNLDNMAGYLLTDANRRTGEVKSSGIFLPNEAGTALQFYQWDQAVEVLNNNQQILDYHFNKIKQIQEDPDLAASYKKEINNNVRSTVGILIDDINLRNEKLTVIKDIENKVYKNVLSTIPVDDLRTGLGQENLSDWNIMLFDDNGYMIPTETLYKNKVQEIVTNIQNLAPKSLPSDAEIYSKIYDPQTNNIITIDQGIPGALLTTKEAQDAMRSLPMDPSRMNPMMIQKVLGQAVRAKMVKDAAQSVNQDAGAFLVRYYQPTSDGTFKFGYEGSDENKYPIDIANEVLEYGSFKQIIDKVKNQMAIEMDKETAIPFETTFDFDSFYYGNQTDGDMSIAPIIPFRYDAGTKDKYVNQQLDLFFSAIDNMPDNQIFMTEGDAGAEFSMKISENDRRTAELVLNEIRADRNWKPGGGAETKGTPGYRIEYSGYGGGEAADGKYAMYKFILDGDYAKRIASNIDVNFGDGDVKIKDQTITVFLNKELFSNPLDPERQNFSMIKSLINDPVNQGTATLDVPNGGQIKFEMQNGVVYQKYATYSFDGKNMVLGDFSPIQPLVTTDGAPITESNIDRFYIDQKKKLEQLASQNLLLQKQTKLEQSPSDEDDEEN
tara:strand:+ start:13241 stop:16618 length:3378 start_codon:yes stop_codon:yes gene_type:complete